MKLNKICAAALSAAFAAAALTSTASAYIAVPADKSTLLDATGGKWSMAISSSYAMDYSAVYQLQAIVRVTDEEAYLADKASGFYGDTETAFTDFQGQIAFGGSEWLSFGFTGLSDTAGDSANAAVTSLGDGTYSFTANFGSAGISNTAARCTVTFDEWGNLSEDYSLEVLSMSFIAADGSYILSYNEKGNPVVEPAAAETTTTVAETTVPETTTTVEETTTTTTTTEATTTTEETTTTTAAPETEAETSAEETAADTSSEETEAAAEETTTAATTTTTATTTAAVTTSEETAETTAAQTTAAVEQAVGGTAADFSKRDNQLMVFAIAAIAVIVAVVIGFIIIAIKRRK